MCLFGTIDRQNFSFRKIHDICRTKSVVGGLPVWRGAAGGRGGKEGSEVKKSKFFEIFVFLL